MQRKIVTAKVEPLPKEFLKITEDLSSLCSSGINVYEEPDFVFLCRQALLIRTESDIFPKVSYNAMVRQALITRFAVP